MSPPVRKLLRTVYFGTFVHTPSFGLLETKHETAVGVDEDGRIAFIESLPPGEDLSSILTVKGWSGCQIVNRASAIGETTFFFPGFIDTHTHASQYPNTGIFGTSTLLSWLDTYTFPLESSFSSLGRAKTVYSRVVRRSLSHGTTCAAYYATVHITATNLLADICLSVGQRALVGRVCMDRMSPNDYQDESPQSAVESTRQCIQYIESIDPGGELVRPVITPRFAPSCTDDCLTGLGQLQKDTNHFVQTHISENKGEIDLVHELFPGSKDYASVYDKAGLLGDKTILAHAVHLTRDEVRMVSERKSKISHCPTSNTCLTSGAAPVRHLLDSGILVGLGTDMSGGYSPSILEMTRQALLVSRHVAMAGVEGAQLTVAEGLWLATRGGAHVVGLEKVVGAFELGMHFDAQIVTLRHVKDETQEEDVRDMRATGPVDVFGWEAWDDRVAKWVYCGDDRNVQAVWVRGRLVHGES